MQARESVILRDGNGIAVRAAVKFCHLLVERGLIVHTRIGAPRT